MRFVLMALALTLHPLGATAADGGSQALQDVVRPEALRGHLQALQAIADDHGGNRAAGGPGYAASVDYVVAQLTAAGYAPVRQRFTFPTWKERGPSDLRRLGREATAYAYGKDFNVLARSAPGTVEAEVQPIDLFGEDSATSGCEEEDFAGFAAGRIALLRRGTCPFRRKVENAAEAGAVGVIVVNREDEDGLIEGTLGRGRGAGGVPAFLATAALGASLAGVDGLRLEMNADVEHGTAASVNVLAETPGGRDDRVVVLGAHLDSVPEGPGINDNASGVAAVLEIAKQLAALDVVPLNRVRFAFWGAEEQGLVGSRHYVESLGEAGRERIALALNLDMLASPNFGRFVYKGDGSGRGNPGPEESETIERVLREHFEAKGLAVASTSLRSGSDHAPFARAGLPVGGLYTGSWEEKTPEQAAAYGGEAGELLDSCYHEACDDLANADLTVLDQMADAAAHALHVFATRPWPPKTPAG